MPRWSLQGSGRLLRNASASGRICSCCGQYQRRALHGKLTAEQLYFRLARIPRQAGLLQFWRQAVKVDCFRSRRLTRNRKHSGSIPADGGVRPSGLRERVYAAFRRRIRCGVRGRSFTSWTGARRDSVGKYIVRTRKPPTQTWRNFLANDVKTLVSNRLLHAVPDRFRIGYAGP